MPQALLLFKNKMARFAWLEIKQQGDLLMCHCSLCAQNIEKLTGHKARTCPDWAHASTMVAVDVTKAMPKDVIKFYDKCRKHESSSAHQLVLQEVAR